jgi:hypothetical protein
LGREAWTENLGRVNPVHEAISGGLTDIGQIKHEIYCPSALPDMAKNVIMRKTHQYLSRCDVLSEQGLSFANATGE